MDEFHDWPFVRRKFAYGSHPPHGAAVLSSTPPLDRVCMGLCSEFMAVLESQIFNIASIVTFVV